MIAVEGPPVVLENLYRHHDAVGHEIVFACPVQLLDETLYARLALSLTEDNGAVVGAERIALDDLRSGRVALYPEGLLTALEDGLRPS